MEVNWPGRFTQTIEYGKFLGIVGLFIASVAYGNKAYVEREPRKFIWDSFTSGALAAVAFTLIAMIRNRPDLIPSLAIISFFLFFTFNVFCEFSGLNEMGGDTKNLSGGKGQDVNKKITKPLIAVGVIVLVILSYIAFAKSRVRHPDGFGKLMLEALIFGATTAAAQVIIVKNHGAGTDMITATGVGSLVIFAYIHIMFQYGGLYQHIFESAPPCIQ